MGALINNLIYQFSKTTAPHQLKKGTNMKTLGKIAFWLIGYVLLFVMAIAITIIMMLYGLIVEHYKVGLEADKFLRNLTSIK